MKTINYTAKLNDSVEANLRNEGISSRIITKLRKEIGLIYSITRKIPLRTIDKLTINENYKITIKDDKVREIPDYKIDLDFIYEDDDLAVINKPYNLPVISTSNHYSKTLENALHFVWGDFVYRPVTRLDKDTSGLMIIAKNQLTHSLLQKQKIIKKYTAAVSGQLYGSGTINAPIYKNETGSMKRIIDPRGKTAITDYVSKIVYNDYSIIEFTLHTGRTHQIRVHSSHIGHPLLCDFLYNPNPEPFKLINGNVISRTALHSSYLEFINPISNKHIILNSKADFE